MSFGTKSLISKGRRLRIIVTTNIVSRSAFTPPPLALRTLDKVIIFAERVLPSTQTYIPAQVNQLQHFAAIYAGLLPAEKNMQLTQVPILLRQDRTATSRVARELYRWTGASPNYHRQLRSLEAKLIHAHFAEGGPAAFSLSRKLNLPLILHLHGGLELMKETDLRRKPYAWPFLAHRGGLMKRASAFLCVSEHVKRLALRAGFPAEKTWVHLAALDCSTFAPKLPSPEKDANLVLFVGRLIPYKGCDYLIRAMKRVQQSRPGVRLVIIGDGSSRSGLEALSRSLDVTCEFLGEQRPAEVRMWLERARVFCAPSVTLQDGQSEAFGIVFLEAQAMGVPVVSFRHGGIPETMLEGVTGLLADERDVNGLAGQLLRYLGDDLFWNLSRQEGVRWVRKNFDPKIQAAKLEAIYCQAIRAFRSDRFAQCIRND